MNSVFQNIYRDLLFFFAVVKPSCHDAQKERTAQDSGCMNSSFLLKSRSEQEKNASLI